MNLEANANDDNIPKILDDETDSQYSAAVPLEAKEIGPTNTEPYPLLRVAHSEGSSKAMKTLAWVSVVCILFMATEIVGGVLANSLAIMTDAAHLLSDFSGFVISMFSIWVGTQPASKGMTFGFHRAEVIGAMGSVVFIWGLTVWLLYEASIRFMNPTPVDGFIMLITACIGLVCNLVMMKVLHSGGHHHHGHSHGHDHGNGKKVKDEEEESHAEHGHEGHKHGPGEHDHKHGEKGHEHKHGEKEHEHKHEGHDHEHDHGGNVNIRAALIHVIGDILQSIGVIIAAIIIYFIPGTELADPICTFIFSIIVVFTTVPIMKDCMRVLVEGTPYSVNTDKLYKNLMNLPGVHKVHDLHVWSLSVGKLALSVHLESDTPLISLNKATRLCREKYKIGHTTIQVEGFNLKEHSFPC